MVQCLGKSSFDQLDQSETVDSLKYRCDFLLLNRFGKHRKATDSEYQVDMDEEEEEDLKRDESEERQREDARLAAQEEYEKIQEQYRKLIMRQHQENHVKFIKYRTLLISFCLLQNNLF